MRERSQKFDPRQTMQSRSFEVFHYKEPSPHAVEVHHHDFYEVYYLLGGHVEYWVDGRIIPMEPGDLLLISPMELHRPMIHRGQIYERIVLWINKDFLEKQQRQDASLAACFDDPGHAHLLRPTSAERSALTAQLGELVREYYGGGYGSALSAYGLFLQFMVRINRIAHYAGARQEESQQMSSLVQRVLLYISENLGQTLSLESLAERFYISKYHLSHAFSREVGVSLHRYIMLRRLLMARQLLGAGDSAGAVARTCGFSDYTSFFRAFKSEYGISPSQYASGK